MSTLPHHRTVADVMTKRVHMANPRTPFKGLVRLIEENRVSAVPIVDLQGVPVGVVSESDLLFKQRRAELEAEANFVHVLRQRHDRAKAAGLVAADLMTSPPITVTERARLGEAAQIMQERHVRRLVVIDERGLIAGIVTRSDLLQVFLRTDEDLREEVVERVIPAILLAKSDAVEVDVSSNVITLSGEVDRKSDAEILAGVTQGLDGVVGVVNRMSFRWDDTRT